MARRQLSKRKKLLFACVALMLVAFVGLLIGEVAVRVSRGKLFSTESVLRRNERAGNPVFKFSEDFGWEPVASVARPGKDGKSRVTTDEHGLRVSGHAVSGDARPILAVGDSFTWGDEVDDDETWPAYLESILNRRVLNGGVAGYGVDQAVLRAEHLIDEHQPSIVILSMIENDVRRCELKYRYDWKPYFMISGDGLKLEGHPVPKAKPPTRLPWLREALGYSHLADVVLSKVAWRWWWFDGAEHEVHMDGPKVVALLVDRLRAKAKAADAELIVLFQPSHTLTDEPLRVAIEHCETNDVPMVNLFPLFKAQIKDDPDWKAKWLRPRKHMTPRGNKWIAEHLAEKVNELDGKP